MSTLPEDQTAGAARDDWLLLEYDYFKHLSTIALVALGAILTWIQGNPKSAGLFFILGLSLVAISAVLGFGAMNQIIDHRKSHKPLGRLFGWQRSLVTGTFATGLGMFMSEIGRALN